MHLRLDSKSTKFELILACLNAAEIELQVSLMQRNSNSTKFALKLAGSNAAEIELHLEPGLQTELELFYHLSLEEIALKQLII